jgi:hypothetical protein
MKIVLISPSCTKCKELLERSSVFRQFVSEVNSGKGVVAVGEEAYLYGFDYSDSNIFFGRVGFSTPSVLDSDSFEVVALPDFSVRDFVAFLKKMPRYYRGKKGGDEGESGSRSRRKRNEFVERKQLRKDLKKALEGCLGDVCVEQ